MYRRNDGVDGDRHAVESSGNMPSSESAATDALAVHPATLVASASTASDVSSSAASTLLNLVRLSDPLVDASAHPLPLLAMPPLNSSRPATETASAETNAEHPTSSSGRTSYAVVPLRQISLLDGMSDAATAISTTAPRLSRTEPVASAMTRFAGDSEHENRPSVAHPTQAPGTDYVMTPDLPTATSIMTTDTMLSATVPALDTKRDPNRKESVKMLYKDTSRQETPRSSEAVHDSASANTDRGKEMNASLQSVHELQAGIEELTIKNDVRVRVNVGADESSISPGMATANTITSTSGVSTKTATTMTSMSGASATTASTEATTVTKNTETTATTFGVNQEMPPTDMKRFEDMYQGILQKMYYCGFVYKKNVKPIGPDPTSTTGGNEMDDEWSKWWMELRGSSLNLWRVPDNIAVEVYAMVETPEAFMAHELDPSAELVKQIKMDQFVPETIDMKGVVCEMIPYSYEFGSDGVEIVEVDEKEIVPVVPNQSMLMSEILQEMSKQDLNQEQESTQTTKKRLVKFSRKNPPPVPYSSLFAVVSGGSKILFATMSGIVSHEWVSGVRLLSVEMDQLQNEYTNHVLGMDEYKSVWDKIGVKHGEARDYRGDVKFEKEADVFVNGEWKKRHVTVTSKVVDKNRRVTDYSKRGRIVFGEKRKKPLFGIDGVKRVVIAYPNHVMKIEGDSVVHLRGSHQEMVVMAVHVMAAFSIDADVAVIGTTVSEIGGVGHEHVDHYCGIKSMLCREGKAREWDEWTEQGNAERREITRAEILDKLKQLGEFIRSVRRKLSREDGQSHPIDLPSGSESSDRSDQSGDEESDSLDSVPIQQIHVNAPILPVANTSQGPLLSIDKKEFVNRGLIAQISKKNSNQSDLVRNHLELERQKSAERIQSTLIHPQSFNAPPVYPLANSVPTQPLFQNPIPVQNTFSNSNPSVHSSNSASNSDSESESSASSQSASESNQESSGTESSDDDVPLNNLQANPSAIQTIESGSEMSESASESSDDDVPLVPSHMHPPIYNHLANRNLKSDTSSVSDSSNHPLAHQFATIASRSSSSSGSSSHHSQNPPFFANPQTLQVPFVRGPPSISTNSSSSHSQPRQQSQDASPQVQIQQQLQMQLMSMQMMLANASSGHGWSPAHLHQMQLQMQQMQLQLQQMASMSAPAQTVVPGPFGSQPPPQIFPNQPMFPQPHPQSMYSQLSQPMLPSQPPPQQMFLQTPPQMPPQAQQMFPPQPPQQMFQSQSQQQMFASPSLSSHQSSSSESESESESESSSASSVSPARMLASIQQPIRDKNIPPIASHNPEPSPLATPKQKQKQPANRVQRVPPDTEDSDVGSESESEGSDSQ